MAGQLRVDEITDEAGTGSPSFPQKITPSSLGTGTPTAAKVLNGAGEWVDGTSPGELLLLQEDTFTTSGTWTKASGYEDTDTVVMFIFGGGGSGGAGYVTTGAGAATGGANGEGVVLYAPYSRFFSTATLTAGAGGVAVTRSTAGFTAGNGGGLTTLVYNDVTLTRSAGAGGKASSSAINGDGSMFGLAYPPNTSVNTLTVHLLAFNTGSNANPTGASTVNDNTTFISTAGAAARTGATNHTKYNGPTDAGIRIAGAGSGTANGQDGIGVGGGGGGCVRQNATAVSGAGSNGGLLVRYYRGAADILAILSGA